MTNKIFTSVAICLISISISIAQNVTKTFVNDFKMVIGDWRGSLTYLDYTSGKPFTMPADLHIKRIDKSNDFSFENLYPKEPHANSIDTLSISDDGTAIDKQAVKSREKLANGNLKIVTEILGKDGNEGRAALIRHTYLVGSNVFVITKEVRFLNEAKWLKRNEFSYSR